MGLYNYLHIQIQFENHASFIDISYELMYYERVEIWKMSNDSGMMCMNNTHKFVLEILLARLERMPRLYMFK